MAKVIVSRLEPYPIEEPNCFVVGFTATCDNGRSFYVDAQVPFDQMTEKTDEEAVGIAREMLFDVIRTQITALESKSPLVGQEIEL